MTLVRTNWGAIASGSLMIGLVVLVSVTTGLGVAAQKPASLDAQVVLVLSASLAYAVNFTLGHLWLRQRHMNARVAYAAIGAVAAIPSFLLGAGLRGLMGAAASGALSAALLVPLLGGGIVGFLYQRRAGYEADTTGAPPLIPFDGVAVVRTSPGAIVVAALLASALLMLGIFTLIASTGGFIGPVPASVRGPGSGVPQAILGGAMMCAPCIYLAHRILRAMGRTSMRAYAVSGLVGPGMIACLMLVSIGVFAVIGAIQFAIPSVIGMIAYRTLAGLQSAPPPETVEVRGPAGEVRGIASMKAPPAALAGARSFGRKAAGR